MDLESANDLKETEPWQWPGEIAHKFRAVLRDRKADPEVRLIVADIAGNIPEMTPGLADALLDVVAENSEPEDVRAKAAISLGPTLELVDWADEEPEEMPVPQKTYLKIARTLERLYADTRVPKVVRRRILEAAVRGPREDWHEEAVRTALASEDQEWKLTAVFCLRYVRGFDEVVLANLQTQDAEILYEAVEACGSKELDAAWPKLAEIAKDEAADRDVRLAAIEALANIRPAESLEILERLQDHEDKELAEIASEAWSDACFRIANPEGDEEFDEDETFEDDDIFDEGEEDDAEDEDEDGESEPGPGGGGKPPVPPVGK